jgi:hypothetical protein
MRVIAYITRNSQLMTLSLTTPEVVEAMKPHNMLIS